MLNKILDYTIIEPNLTIIKETKEYFLIKLNKSKYNTKIPKKINKKIAYIFGVIMGDGNLALSKRKESKYPRVKLRIFNNSENYLKNINKWFKEIFNVQAKIYKKRYNNCYVLELNNKLVWLFFSKHLSIQNKKLRLNLPNSLQNKPLFKFFLAGLIDTDGYFNKSNHVYGLTLHDSHYSLLEKIKEKCIDYYNIKMLGPYLQSVKINNKKYKKCTLTTSRYSTEKFRKLTPLMIK